MRRLPVVALDCEWEPEQADAPVSIAQLSFGSPPSLIVILDLIATCDGPQRDRGGREAAACSAVVSEVISIGAPFLGFGVAGDLRRLAATRPTLGEWHRATMVELRDYAQGVKGVRGWTLRFLIFDALRRPYLVYIRV